MNDEKMKKMATKVRSLGGGGLRVNRLELNVRMEAEGKVRRMDGGGRVNPSHMCICGQVTDYRKAALPTRT